MKKSEAANQSRSLAPVRMTGHSERSEAKRRICFSSRAVREFGLDAAKSVAGWVAVLLVMGALASAQEKAAPAEAANQVTTPLQVTVVFNEYDGSKRISTLPYQMACNARLQPDTSSLRLGLKVPISVGTKESSQYQYQSVSTDIDCRATASLDGAFLIGLGLRRNVVSPPSGSPTPEQQPGPSHYYPITGQFEADLKNLLLRNGETVQAATATDPVTGNVWKIDVSLKVGK
jgi:hypothetical protein